MDEHQASLGARFFSTSSSAHGAPGEGSPKLQAAVDTGTSLSRTTHFIHYSHTHTRWLFLLASCTSLRCAAGVCGCAAQRRGCGVQNFTRPLPSSPPASSFFTSPLWIAAVRAQRPVLSVFPELRRPLQDDGGAFWQVVVLGQFSLTEGPVQVMMHATSPREGWRHS